MPVLCMAVWILLTWMCNVFSGVFLDPAIEPRAQELKVRFEHARFARLMSRVYVQVFYSGSASSRISMKNQVIYVVTFMTCSNLRFRCHSLLFVCS